MCYSFPTYATRKNDRHLGGKIKRIGSNKSNFSLLKAILLVTKNIIRFNQEYNLNIKELSALKKY